MKINIVLNYINIDKYYKIYAFNEKTIDFRRQKKEATRCTISFAAVELENYLLKLIKDLKITISDKIKNDSFNIELIAKSDISIDESYTIEPTKMGIKIIGENRVGVLYGAYEFLKMQGIMWFEPGEIGEFVPQDKIALIIPKEKMVFSTKADICRGFSLDGYLNENEELEIWMARNRLNTFFYRPFTCKLMKKLGFKLNDGGHIFEAILDPNNITENGKTFWEEHNDWYGVPAKGNKTKEEAEFTQFCVSQNDLIEYLANKLINKLNNEWYESDVINVWGFDTWESVCSCQDCQKLGNGTDQNLYMFSKFREAIDKAISISFTSPLFCHFWN